MPELLFCTDNVSRVLADEKLVAIRIVLENDVRMERKYRPGETGPSPEVLTPLAAFKPFAEIELFPQVIKGV